ncbi:complex I NDUFA9 subunit family protein [Aurantimonas sp. C2-6-R+9]|uniref:complex I NDUFA9 subunit family protein n=1 Tax=unclassified Aurantimonas TaxID=2638230 RepID=UPI002E19D18D|nr:MULTISPECIES: complex I NDUFA9 subunit family protein [unclassified Aurantimonas]MEC5291493.1 complex I NDUFA9 subunit family protein [Aurantimonas sp. C2-3-R2]MEC5381641.1 complex I NDUFA9 subunit family protein [Aurantimonas sp. C2-6-R+9]MEC5412579.1 complex I NDUFA9 subunit family protein [Aurantimonas sp. C2-4-R8]
MAVDTGKTVVVFGGSGFLGRYVTLALARRGYRIRVACRRPDLAYHLQTNGNMGQIMPVQANLRYRWTVDRAVVGADHVINLVGILAESGRQNFEAVQSFGAQAVAEAARGVGARMTQISAIGADASSDSAYARTKAAGEQAVRETIADATIIRPSIVFGAEDQFFNRFAQMARFSPVLPLIGGGRTRFQPVYVGDVAEAIAATVDGKVAGGRVYELGGPEILTFRELMEEMLAVIARKRRFVTIPFGAAASMARVMRFLPGAPLTEDQVRQLRHDNVVSEEAIAEGRDLAAFGLKGHTIDAILPTYLVRFRPEGQFTTPQPQAGGLTPDEKEFV